MTTIEKDQEKENYDILPPNDQAIIRAALELLRALAVSRYESANAVNGGEE